MKKEKTPSLIYLLMSSIALIALFVPIVSAGENPYDVSTAVSLPVIPVSSAPEMADPGDKPPATAESNVISLIDRQGFHWRTPSGDFEFNPYLLTQTYFQGKYVNNNWLNLADQDNVTELGFGTANAVFGIAGKGFGKLSFNLTLNGACTGPCLLNQAWVDLNTAPTFRVQVGKFKTPMYRAFQVRLGQTELPRLPASLTARVNLPFGLNAASPQMLTGFDTGVMIHGDFQSHFGYQVGIFGGEGIGVNAPTSTLSDDTKLPGLLYAGRLTYSPYGPMPLQEGSSAQGSEFRLLVGGSSSYNVEANAESSDDLRAGLEFVIAKESWYWASEAYALQMSFVERQRGTPGRLFWGGHTQLGKRLAIGIEPVLRFEVFDRNSTDDAGILFIPAIGCNYYISEQNLKLQAMYQSLARIGYANDLSAHQDDNGMPDGTFVLQLQFVL